MQKKVPLPTDLKAAIHRGFKKTLGYSFQGLTIESVTDTEVCLYFKDPVLDDEVDLQERDILEGFAALAYFKEAEPLAYYSRSLLACCGSQDTTPSLHFRVTRETQF